MNGFSILFPFRESIIFDLFDRFVAALAKDLRDEFYIYLVKTEKPVLSTIINLLDTKESEQLEWALICLAHLFKILKPYLKKDFTTVFESLLPLLDAGNADYITNFAVECFAFVARDIIDKEKFLTAILSKLSHRIDEDECSESVARGCGQLLFEVIRGVNGQFHSCAEGYLRVYFVLITKLKSQKSDLLFDILSNMINVLVQFITPANMQTFWDAFYYTLAEFKQDKSDFNDSALKKLLSLMGQAVEIRDGKFLTKPNQFVSELMEAIDMSENSDECLHCISNLVTVLLLAKNVVLTQLDASRIIKKVLTIPSTEVFEAFVWNCVKYQQFEILILPEFVRYIDSKHFGMGSLELMAKIILHKSPLSGDGIAMDNRKIYPIRLRSGKCLEKIKTILNQTDTGEEFFTNPREYLLALIIYPHIIGAEVTPILKKINEKIEICLNALKPHDAEIPTDSENAQIRVRNQRIIFILSILFETQIQLRELQANGEKTSRKGTISLKNIVSKLLPFSSCENFRYIHALRVLDLIISFESSQSKDAKSPEFNAELFKTIHNELSNNLSSRYHTIRRTTVHLFQQFSDELKISGTNLSIYNVFFDVESIESTIHSYREQLLLLQRIEPNAKFMLSLSKIHEPMKFDPLKFLLGFLHVNFNLLWKPITELITTYFDELNIEEFWSLYKAKIDETTALQRRKQSDDIQNNDQFIDLDTCLGDEYSKIWQNNERSIDMVNYRILLWRNIPSLGMLREIKNREIVTMFLDFIEHEYKRTIDRDTLTLQAQRKRKTLKKKSYRGKAPSNEAENDDDLVDEDGEEQVVDDQNVPAGTQRTLINMLQVFVNQNNPKQLHREPELWTLYMELLSHRNSAVQKLALDCIAAYKHKYLQPYMDHLYGLVDDAKFKGALATFEINKESGSVQQEHRPQLMPIVMRILFSKMVTRVGGQKTSNQTRKALIMRFLGGCYEEEILLMLHMAFWMFEGEFKDDAREMCLDVSDFFSSPLSRRQTELNIFFRFRL